MSDNCTSQYKSSKHFYNMQNIANKYEKTVFQVFGNTGHGKGEVDHVGGIAKVVIRRQIAAGSFFPDSSDMVEFLNEKFKDHDSPRYKFKEIDTKQLEIARNLVKNKSFQGIHGSSHFQLMTFTPHMNVIKALNCYAFVNHVKTFMGPVLFSKSLF